MSVRTETSDDHATLWLDRPDKKNALDLGMSHAIGAALDELREVERVLVIRSTTPGAFVAGADIGDLSRRTRVEAMARVNHELFQRLEDHPWPTVALVDGPALGGGCELALACDFRVASTRSAWGQPEVRLGLIPSAGGLWRLPRLVGWAHATDLVLTGRRIDGQEAHRIGLVNRLAGVDELEQACADLLRELTAASMTAVRYAKEAMRVPPDHRRVVDAALQALCYEGGDARERLGAFLQRRA